MSSFKVGPNRLKPAEKTWSIDRNECVKLRIGEDEMTSREPISVPGLLARTARDHPDHAALIFRNSKNEWETVTFSQYRDKVFKIAKTFIKLGLEPHQSVAILAYNSPEWFISELAAIHAGGITAGVYTTNSAESTHFVLDSSEANIVVVDDTKQMEKIRSIRHRLPKLKAVIQTLPPYESFVKEEDGYYKWSDIVQWDVEDQTEELNRRLENIAINECCCLVYTSGTVGTPKGVMLNHDNLTWDAFAVGKRLGNIQYAREVLISYLPLSHIAAQMVDIYLTIQFAATIYFADKDALKGTLVKTLQAARPTRFLGVPRVYEKIQEKMISVGAQNTGVKKMIGEWAKRVTLQHYMDIIEGKPTNSWQYRLAKNLILSKVKEALGLDRCITLASAAAPMSPDVKKYFMSLDLPLNEAFGMSETGGAHTITSMTDYNFDTIGKHMNGVETKIHNKDANGHGEILLRGRHIFMGYVGELEKTREALDDEGWLHSGDIGYIDEKGLVYITGRLKELIITAGGENIPPVHIEHLVKNELPWLSNAVLIGDKRKFLSMLVTIKTELDPDGEPLDKLHPEVLQLTKKLGLEYTTLSDILAAGPCPKIWKAVEDGIIRANKQAISNAQKVQKFAILPHDLSVKREELGPTLKVKRNIVVKNYHDIIEEFYK